MPGPRFAVRLLAYGGALGVREELIGDVLEEIARGRSRLWVYQQLIGVYGLAFVTQVRHRVRLTPQVVALALGAALLVGVSVASAKTVVAAWLAFYYTTGTLSLFAHMMSHTGRARVTETPEGGEAPASTIPKTLKRWIFGA